MFKLKQGLIFCATISSKLLQAFLNDKSVVRWKRFIKHSRPIFIGRTDGFLYKHCHTFEWDGNFLLGSTRSVSWLFAVLTYVLGILLSNYREIFASHSWFSIFVSFGSVAWIGLYSQWMIFKLIHAFQHLLLVSHCLPWCSWRAQQKRDVIEDVPYSAVWEVFHEYVFFSHSCRFHFPNK